MLASNPCQWSSLQRQQHGWQRVCQNRVRNAGRVSLIVRAKEQRDSGDNDKWTKLIKERGIDKQTARRILKVWQDSGVQDAKQLQQLIVKDSMRPLVRLGIQLLLDTGACAGAFVAVNSLAVVDFPGKIAVDFGLYALTLYFGISVFFDVVSLGAVAATTLQYGANTAAVLQALQEIADADTGPGVVGRAKTAVNILKVVQTLNSISQLLKEELASGKGETTLESLSAMLTLATAQERRGFNAEKFGLTDAEAANIAKMFARWDLNDDYRLEPSEIRKLCRDLGKELSDDEVKEAVRLLDSDKSGYIEFDEFVSWWVNQVPTPGSEGKEVEPQSNVKDTL